MPLRSHETVPKTAIPSVPSTKAELPIDLDRAERTRLAAQTYGAIRVAIETGQLASGAKLTSWRDLAAQLGVSRGTVRVAYERLIAGQFAIIVAAGIRVAERLAGSSALDWLPEAPPLPDLFHDFGPVSLIFGWACPLMTHSTSS